MQSTILAMIDVHLCVCLTLSQPGVMSKPLKLRSCSVHVSCSLMVNFTMKLHKECRKRAPNETGRKNMQFSANRSPYLRNGARKDHIYNDGLIRSRIHAFDWYQNHQPCMTLKTDMHSAAEEIHLLALTTKIWIKIDQYYPGKWF